MHVVREVLSRGHEATIVDNLSTQPPGKFGSPEGSRMELSDVTRYGHMRDVLSGHDVVIHMAARCIRESLTNPEPVERTNALGTMNVALAVRDLKIPRLVYVSSSEVYGPAVRRDRPMNESHPLEPTTIYGASKLAGEFYVSSLLKKPIIIRPFNTYGPGAYLDGFRGELIPRTVARLLQKKPVVIHGDGNQSRDFIYVTDCAKGIVDAALMQSYFGKPFHIFNLASGKDVSVLTIVSGLEAMIGATKIDYTEARPGEVSCLCGQAFSARSSFGWEPKVEFKEGLAATIEDIRERLAKGEGTGIEDRTWRV